MKRTLHRQIQKKTKRVTCRTKGIQHFVRACIFEEVEQPDLSAAYALLGLSSFSSTPTEQHFPETPTRVLELLNHSSPPTWRAGCRRKPARPGRYTGTVVPLVLRQLWSSLPKTCVVPRTSPLPMGSPSRPRPQKRPSKTRRFVSTREGEVEVTAIPSDGDCLFLAVAHQLYGEEVGSAAHIQSATTLRSVAANYLEDNITKYFIHLMDEVQYWGRKFDDVSDVILKEEQKILVAKDIPDLGELTQETFQLNLKKIVKYLSVLRKNHQIWGGQTSLQAIAECLRVSVLLHNEHSTQTLISPEAELPEARVQISHRRYSPTTEHPDHYDSVLHEGIPGKSAFVESFCTLAGYSDSLY